MKLNKNTANLKETTPI